MASGKTLPITQFCVSAGLALIPNYQTELNSTPRAFTSARICKIFTTAEREEGEERWALPIPCSENKFTQERIREGLEVGEAGGHMNIEIIKAGVCCCFLLLVFGTLSTFITLLHLVWVSLSPPSASPQCHPASPLPVLLSSLLPSFLLATRTLKSLRGAAASRSNESVCCHFSDARCEIKRAVYVRAVAGIKRRAHIGRRQLLQSLQAHIYVPFVQFAICRTKPIF